VKFYKGKWARCLKWQFFPPDLNTLECVVLNCLISHSNDDSLAHPKQETIAESTRLNLYSVNRILKSLERKGHITSFRRTDGKRCKLYQIHLPDFSPNSAPKMDVTLAREASRTLAPEASRTCSRSKSDLREKQVAYNILSFLKDFYKRLIESSDVPPAPSPNAPRQNDEAILNFIVPALEYIQKNGVRVQLAKEPISVEQANILQAKLESVGRKISGEVSTKWWNCVCQGRWRYREEHPKRGVSAFKGVMDMIDFCLDTYNSQLMNSWDYKKTYRRTDFVVDNGFTRRNGTNAHRSKKKKSAEEIAYYDFYEKMMARAKLEREREEEEATVAILRT
jgi:hypothetical protein